MLIKKYEVRCTDIYILRALAAKGESTSWIITAPDLSSAWRKFCHKYGGKLELNPSCFNIRFDSTSSV